MSTNLEKLEGTITTMLEKLQSTITTMDCFSQNGFSEISTLADMALDLMETEQAYLSPETIAQVLTTIRDKAKETENLINCEAEGVGCHYKDEAAERRYEAKRAADLRRHEVQEKGAS